MFSPLSLLFFHLSQSGTRPSNDPTSDDGGGSITRKRVKVALDLFDGHSDGDGDGDGDEDEDEVRIFSYCFSSSVGPL